MAFKRCSCALGDPFCGICGCPNNPGSPGHTHRGSPCSHFVAKGATKCYLHGGASPLALSKANQMLALLRVPAIEAVYKVMDLSERIIEQFSQNTCPTCGYPKGDTDEIHSVAKVCAVLLRDAQTVFDRTGLHPKVSVEVGTSEDALDVKSLTDDERSRMMTKLAELRDLRDEIKNRINGVTVGQPPTIM